MEEWLLAVERYCRVTEGEDAPYAYNERANVGLLAAAAWRCGRVALEEFQFEKGAKYRPKWAGRADLWMASEDTEEFVEAKFCWVSLQKRREIAEVVGPAMQAAVKDAKASTGGNGAKAIGVGFFPVYLPASRVEAIDDLIQAILDEFKEAPHHAIAWCFPERMREFTPRENVLPGLIMLVMNADCC